VNASKKQTIAPPLLSRNRHHQSSWSGKRGR